MQFKSFEQIQRPEKRAVDSIDKKTETDLQRRMEGLLPKAKEQYKEYLEGGEKKLWQMRNQGIIEYVKEARELIEEHGSSQVVERLLEEKEIETQSLDDARLLAFCRLVEVNKSLEN